MTARNLLVAAAVTLVFVGAGCSWSGTGSTTADNSNAAMPVVGGDVMVNAN